MSAVITDTTENNVAEFRSPGPGERLRATRLSLDYDLAHVAAELHLTSSVVDALERDDYDDIGARVFVRGYLRNYARVVSLPEEGVMHQFDDLWPEEQGPGVQVHERPKLPGDVRAGSRWVRLVTWVILLGVLALFLMWWRGYLDAYVPAGVGTAEPGGTQPPAPWETDAEPAFPGISSDGGLNLPALPANAAAPAETQPAAVDTSRRAPESLFPADGVSAVPGQAGPESDALAEVAAAVVPQAPAAAEPVSIPLPAPAAQPATDASVPAAVAAAAVTAKGIVVSFSASCWVDIRDSSRSFKLFGEMAKGTRRVLEGVPPYKVVLGNANAVSITVDGEPFDIESYARGNVARFTLDP